VLCPLTAHDAYSYKDEPMTIHISRDVKTLILAAGVLAFTTAVQAAEGPAGHNHTHNTSAIGESAKATAATRTVQVKLIDNAFEPETIKIKAGETVRFVLTNAGQLLHEFNLGTAAMHAEHQKEMAMMVEHGMITASGIDENMMKMDHSGMQGHVMKHDDPNSVLVGPGETRELVWKFSKTVDLEFACNIPGHYESGMVGKVDFAR
jgi:uncharacterized cupredoxin-like copper-binding protein